MMELTDLQISNIFITLFGCPAFLLVIQDHVKLQKIGTILGFMSNPFWWWMMYLTCQWYTLPIHLLYTWGWFDKAYRLWIKKS